MPHHLVHQSILTTSPIATIMTGLPFGSMTAPAKFSIAPDIIFDLAHDLMQCPIWDPKILPSPLQDKIPNPKRKQEDIPFGTALPADVLLPPNIKGGCGGYIDDGACAILDSPGNQEMMARTKEAVLMALHLLFCPHTDKFKPVLCPEMASIRKLLAEGGLAEEMIFLGWHINTRKFIIALPAYKLKAWTQGIQDILNMDKVKYKDMATLNGRLNHVTFIIPAGRHFLNRLRRAKEKADKYRTTKLTTTSRSIVAYCSLKIKIKFIQICIGINRNIIILCRWIIYFPWRAPEKISCVCL